MKIIYSKTKLIKLVDKEKNLGFVPTMGALHSGHIHLIKCAIKKSNRCIVSIFINKPQFNKKKDFKKYPKVLEKDISILKKLKVDYLYLPSAKQIYPKGINKKIKISNFGNKLCGKYRPSHFKAVADVIDRFIKIIKPNRIFFGEKDMQQLKIIQDFVRLNHPLTVVVGCKTIREKNGIACSSRNLLLSIKEKKTASKIYNLIKDNKKDVIKDINIIKNLKNDILKMGISKIDYLKLLDTNKLIKPFKRKINYKIFIAYYVGSTRLIDNI